MTNGRDNVSKHTHSWYLAEGIWTWCCFSVLSALFFQLRLFLESQNTESIKLTSVPSGSHGWDPGEKSGREPSAFPVPWNSCTLTYPKWLSGDPLLDELLRYGIVGSFSMTLLHQKGRGICGLSGYPCMWSPHLSPSANSQDDRCQL